MAIRNKWKRAYDVRCEKLLGMSYKTAACRLERKWLFELLRELGRNKCYHCPFDVESEEDMSVEHMTAWGGNNAKSLEPSVERFWDIRNLAISHKRCNTSAANAGTGKYKYIGVNRVCDVRRPVPKEKVRAAICVRGDPWTLGEYYDPIEGALAHDLALMFFMKGRGKINFENYRDIYQKFLIDKNIVDESFFIVKNRRLKKAVFELKEMINAKTN